MILIFFECPYAPPTSCLRPRARSRDARARHRMPAQLQARYLFMSDKLTSLLCASSILVSMLGATSKISIFQSVWISMRHAYLVRVYPKLAVHISSAVVQAACICICIYIPSAVMHMACVHRSIHMPSVRMQTARARRCIYSVSA